MESHDSKREKKMCLPLKESRAFSIEHPPPQSTTAENAVSTDFLPQLPVPDLPLRVKPMLPSLWALDAKNPQPTVFSRTVDGNTMDLPAGQPMRNPYGKGYDAAHDESRGKEAMKRLQAHIRERAPYVQLAGSRLQAVTGTRNDMLFDLPSDTPLGPSPALKQFLRSEDRMDADDGEKARSTARGKVDGRKGGKVARVLKSPMRMHTVDKETGRGLREFLLTKGVRHRKRECKSISFHDLTPEMMTMAYQNVLLGHYEAERDERIEVYEVDLYDPFSYPPTRLRYLHESVGRC